MKVTEKSNEIINKFYEFVENGKKKIIEKYVLEEIKLAKYSYKRDNTKLPDLTPVMDDRINELKEINLRKINKRERWLERLFGFISGIAVTLVGAYFKGIIIRK